MNLSMSRQTVKEKKGEEKPFCKTMWREFEWLTGVAAFTRSNHCNTPLVPTPQCLHAYSRYLDAQVAGPWDFSLSFQFTGTAARTTGFWGGSCWWEGLPASPLLWDWVMWGGSGACSLRVQWPWHQVLCVAVKTTLIFFCLLAEARQWEGQRGKRRSQSMQAPTTWESPKCGRGLPLPENSASCFPKGLLAATDIYA